MKAIYNNFIGGISNSDRVGPEGSYYAGAGVSPFQANFYNYLMPQLSASNVDGTSAVADLIVALAPHPNITTPYLTFGVGDTGKFYKIQSQPPLEQVSANATWPYQISAGIEGANGPSNVEGHEILDYKIGSTNCLLYAWDNNTSGSVGRFDLATTFDDDYTATSAATPGMLSAGVPHPMIQGQDGLVYIGNGFNLASYDGQTGANGTWDSVALDLPSNMEITSLFKTTDYLGIAAWQKTLQTEVRTKSSIYLWDYVSETFNQEIPIEDNKITATFVHQGQVYIFTQGQGSGKLRRLTNNGSEVIAELRYKTGSINNVVLNAPQSKAIDSYRDRMVFGTNGPYNCVFSYGKPIANSPDALTLDWILSGISGKIGAIQQYFSDALFFSEFDGTNYYLKYIGTTAYPAYWAGLYTDFGQKVRINYIKYYFRPLVSGDLITPTISLDYATGVGLTDANGNTTISFANDGTITSKRFNVKKDCYTISPILTWGGGQSKIQKIVIDYTPLADL